MLNIQFFCWNWVKFIFYHEYEKFDKKHVKIGQYNKFLQGKEGFLRGKGEGNCHLIASYYRQLSVVSKMKKNKRLIPLGANEINFMFFFILIRKI